MPRQSVLTTSVVRELAHSAAAAPSMHNAQPWRFRYGRRAGVFEVRADFDRTMRHADPDTRALHVGCGAAVLNLRVAAAAVGVAARTMLLPDPRDSALLAAVRLTGPDEAVEHDLAALRPAVHRRHTSRYPFAEKPVPRLVRDEMRAAAAREDTALTFPDSWHLRWVLALAQEAAGRNRADTGADEDLAHWTRVGASASDTATDGVPEYAFGPRKRGGRAPVREFGGDRRTADLGAARFEEHPQIALLSTGEDRPVDWLRAGQGMERALLVATLHGVSASFVTEVLEWRETRWPLRDPVSSTAAVQMVLRFGYGPEGPRTPRRPLAEVLEVVD